MNPIRLFFIIIKEYLKKPGCLFIVLLIPVLTALININQSDIDSHSITIGYYFDCSDETDSNDTTIKDIRKSIKRYDGIYTFVEYDNMEQIKKDLILNNIECCYIIPDNLSQLAYKDKLKKSIEVYISTKSTMNAAINETFYSILFPVISEKNLEKYLSKESAVKSLYKEKTLDIKDIKKDYYKYLTNNSTFHFEFEGEPKEYKTTTTSLLLSPLKGLIGLMILISSLSGAFAYFKESEGLIKRNAGVRITYILVPTVLSGISAFLTIIMSDGKVSDKSPLTVLAIIIAYITICIIFTFLITVLIKSPSLYASLIPMLIIGTMVFTPFIIDFSVFVPVVQYISYIFMPYYFIIWL